MLRIRNVGSVQSYPELLLRMYLTYFCSVESTAQPTLAMYVHPTSPRLRRLHIIQKQKPQPSFLPKATANRIHRASYPTGIVPSLTSHEDVHRKKATEHLRKKLDK
ncbi:hypothetical protein BDV34DRAFT_199064 [Aspergillus parasiticus]|uniref:Uncharacterized protein n=1 Tax=Aspergillus parasiticus TaxID=5067 RepID=A0A5N6DF39_ASPPA|nr:hypothetical protein BDV34DRAFT_199064 [Aspergillus parasiticus]